jgi:hypothetical protein
MPVYRRPPARIVAPAPSGASSREDHVLDAFYAFKAFSGVSVAIYSVFDASSTKFANATPT